MSKVMGKTYCNDSRLINKEYSACIKMGQQWTCLYCNLCCKNIMLSNMGEKAVRNSKINNFQRGFSLLKKISA